MNKKLYITIASIASCILFLFCILLISPTSTKNAIKYNNEINKLTEDELNVYYNDLVNFNSNISTNISYSDKEVININNSIGYITIPSLNLYEKIGTKTIDIYDRCEIPFKNTNTKMYINKILPNTLKVGDIVYVKILDKTLRYTINEIENSDDNIDRYDANQTTLNIRIKTLFGEKVLKCIMLKDISDESQNVHSLMKSSCIISIIISILIIIYIINRKVKKYRVKKNVKREEHYENLRKQHAVYCEDEIYEVGMVPEIKRKTIKKGINEIESVEENNRKREIAGIQLLICGIIIIASLFTKRKER